MERSFTKLLWTSFWSIQNAMVGFLGLTVSVLAISDYVKKDLTVSAFAAIALGTTLLLLLSTLFKAAYDSHKTSRTVLPKLLAAKAMRSESYEQGILCLLTPSPLFSVMFPIC
jgi:hypothetical protein